MKKIKMFLIMLFLSFLFLPSIQALETGSIKGTYMYDDKPFIDITISLYKIADVENVDDEYVFTYLENYSELEHDINSSASSDWQNYANELKSYIETNYITSDFTTQTDIDGNYEFNDLTDGLYLLLFEDIELTDAIYTSVPTLVSLPNYDEVTKSYINDIVINNKVEETLIPQEEPIVEEEEKIPDVPQTSDNIMIYVLILVIAVIALIGLGSYIYKTKKEIDKNEKQK